MSSHHAHSRQQQFLCTIVVPPTCLDIYLDTITRRALENNPVLINTTDNFILRDGEIGLILTDAIDGNITNSGVLLLGSTTGQLDFYGKLTNHNKVYIIFSNHCIIYAKAMTLGLSDAGDGL